MPPTEDFDLVIVGSGSGNMIAGPEMDHWRVAVVEKGVFGGTCLNVGCIPSKMLVYAADVAEQIVGSGKYGIEATLDRVDWPAIRDRVFERIDPIVSNGESYRDGLENMSVVRGEGRFLSSREMAVGDLRLRSPRWLLGAGARPIIPDVPGMADAGFHTSDTIMRIPEVPQRLVILGGGFIATELGHVFGSLGSEVVFVSRGDRLLSGEDMEVSAAVTSHYADRFQVVTRAHAASVSGREGDLRLQLDNRGDGPGSVSGDMLLVAVGRIANGDTLDLPAAGVHTDPTGHRVLTDEYMRTSTDGILAFGDLTNTMQLKHLANLEARIAAHNLLSPEDLQSIDRSWIPHAVFGSPQVAAVGATEQELIGRGREYVKGVQHYSSTAYGWAMEDTESFAKVLADPSTGRLLGAHIVGPQASTLLQPLQQAMVFGQTIDELATGIVYVHPALTEVIEQALLELV